jgi:hypothetical protein
MLLNIKIHRFSREEDATIATRVKRDGSNQKTFEQLAAEFGGLNWNSVRTRYHEHIKKKVTAVQLPAIGASPVEASAVNVSAVDASEGEGGLPEEIPLRRNIKVTYRRGCRMRHNAKVACAKS